MNKKLALSILWLSSLFFLACHLDTAFERSSDLFKYLAKEQQLDISQKNKMQLLILQVGNCGACTREVMNFVGQSLPKLSDTTYVLMARPDKDIEATLSQIDRVKILSDKNNMLGKYGLRYVTDYLFFFENGDIIKWHRLDENGLKNAKKYVK
jgi:thioredoxin-related protein